MKKLLATALLAATLVGCQSETSLGPCVGIDDAKNPQLEYHVSTRNAVVGIFFVETIIVPVVVVLNELECPVAKK